MAVRPVFIPRGQGDTLVDIANVDFSWSAGLAVSQKQKSIASLHENYRQSVPEAKILEVSSKSTQETGRALSAFNMGVRSSGGQFISVESLFQSSKVFMDNGVLRGPFRELMRMAPKEARRAEQLKTSGRLAHFSFQPSEQRAAIIWELEPKTAFYDWLYLNALSHSPLKESVLEFSAFTDIEFNPEKSVNCQAYSVALWCALRQRRLLDKAIPPRDEFIALIERFTIHNTSDGDPRNMRLF
ncbi:DarT1-associated NADAR antitoxin family protein [Klebsiella sp. WOUb02]|uniref:DarT1-associated NADAR antitoxin family protein n=1 Tax=Klebsiella sp. WOUb02 TaxID=3161071 RepID=UPI003CEE22B5